MGTYRCGHTHLRAACEENLTLPLELSMTMFGTAYLPNLTMCGLVKNGRVPLTSVDPDLDPRELFACGEVVEEEPDPEPDGGFPAVTGFTFTQANSTDFEYNWSMFNNGQVIYVETGYDGETWNFFTWIEFIESGPYLQTAWTDSEWPEEGNDFVPGNTYYMRVRYQDVYPDPTTTGSFTVLSFVAV